MSDIDDLFNQMRQNAQTGTTTGGVTSNIAPSTNSLFSTLKENATAMNNGAVMTPKVVNNPTPYSPTQNLTPQVQTPEPVQVQTPEPVQPKTPTQEEIDWGKQYGFLSDDLLKQMSEPQQTSSVPVETALRDIEYRRSGAVKTAEPGAAGGGGRGRTDPNAAAAAKGMTVDEYKAYLLADSDLHALDRSAQAEYTGVQAADDQLKLIQDQINALTVANYGAGNINLSTTPRFDNGDGTYSYLPTTQYVDPATGYVLLIPSAKKQTDGSWVGLTQAEAEEQYRKTGQYLGAFYNSDAAQKYANELLEQQTQYYDRRASLSAQYNALLETYNGLLDKYKNGVYKQLTEASDKFNYEYNPTQYYKDKEQDYTSVLNVIAGLDEIIATAKAGSDEYNSAKRRRDELYTNRMRFATDEELEEIRKAPVYDTTANNPKDDAVTQQITELYERLSSQGIDPETNPEYLSLISQRNELSGVFDDRNAAGDELQRRDALRVTQEADGTEAQLYLDALAEYAAKGTLSPETIQAVFHVESGPASVLGQTRISTKPEDVVALAKSALKKQGFSHREIGNTIDSLMREGNRLRADASAQALAEFTTKNAATELLMTGLSFGTNLLSGPGGLVALAEHALSGSTASTLDPNSAAFAMANATNTIRGAITEKHDLNVDLGKLGTVDLADAAYGIFTSSIDSMLAGSLGSVGLGGTVIGMQAGTQAALEVAQNGGSVADSILTGLTAGVFEGLFESVSIGQFQALKEAKLGANGITDLLTKPELRSILLKNLGKSALTNFSEEFNTELANVIFDQFKGAVLGFDSTNWRTAVANYMTQINPATGDVYTKDEAIQRVAIDQALQIFGAGASGAVQGVLMGGVAQMSGLRQVKAVRDYVTNLSKTQETRLDMLAMGNTFDDKSETKQYSAQKIKEIDAVLNNSLLNAEEKTSRLVEILNTLENDAAAFDQTFADELGEHAPEGYRSSEVMNEALNKLLKGDTTPPHIETATETKIRETQQAVGMSQADSAATSKLLFQLVNGETNLQTRGIGAEVLKSESFRSAVQQLTGMELKGNDTKSIKKSLNEIAKTIRDSDVIDLSPKPTVETEQTNLVQPTETQAAPADDLNRGGWYNQTAEQAAFMKDVMGRVAGNTTAATQQTEATGAPAQPAQTQPAQTQPAQTQQVHKRGDKIRFSAAETTENGAGKLTQLQQMAEKIYNVLLSDSGVKVRVVSGDPALVGATGMHNPGEITINADQREYVNPVTGERRNIDATSFAGMSWVLGHELYHEYATRTGGEAALKRVQELMKALAKDGVLTGRYAEIAKSDKAWDKLRNEYRPRWVPLILNEVKSKYGDQLTDVQAIAMATEIADRDYVDAEIAGDFLGSIFGFNAGNAQKGLFTPGVNRTQALISLANIDRGVVQDTADRVSDAVEAADEAGHDNAEVGNLRDFLLDLGTALYFSDENKNSGAKYSAADLDNMAFGEQIDLACTGDLHRDEPMHVGKTGAFLQSLGLNDSSQYMTQNKFFLSVYGFEGQIRPVEPGGQPENTHAVTYDTMERLPELLNDPVMVYKSRHEDGAQIIVVTTATDKNGLPVVAVVNPDGTTQVNGEEVDSNFVESVYGARKFVYNKDKPDQSTLRQIVREGLLMWADEEKSRNLTQRYQERFPISGTSDEEGAHLDYPNPLSGFVFGKIIQKWNPGVKDFERNPGVMEPIQNLDTGRVYGNVEEFSSDAKAEAENQGLFYDGYMIRPTEKGAQYIAYAMGPDGVAEEIYHGEGLETLSKQKPSNKDEVLKGGSNAETRVYVPNGRDTSVQTADFTTSDDNKALMIESMKRDGRDQRSDYALRRELARAASGDYDLLVWADGNAQMNSANPYYTTDAAGNIEGQKQLTNIYDKGFTDFYKEYAPVETFFLPDAEQKVAPERYVQLQSERDSLMQQLNDVRGKISGNAQGAELTELQLQARQLQNRLIDTNAELSDIRNNNTKDTQKGAAVPGIRITDELRGRIAAERLGRFSAADEFDQLDREYFDALGKDDKEAQRIVDEIAAARGFRPTHLYHGTQSFGFTEFDLNRMDDKRSIFLVDSPRVAETYSGVPGTRQIDYSFEERNKPQNQPGYFKTAPISEVLAEYNRLEGEDSDRKMKLLSNEDLDTAFRKLFDKVKGIEERANLGLTDELWYEIVNSYDPEEADRAVKAYLAEISRITEDQNTGELVTDPYAADLREIIARGNRAYSRLKQQLNDVEFASTVRSLSGGIFWPTRQMLTIQEAIHSDKPLFSDRIERNPESIVGESQLRTITEDEYNEKRHIYGNYDLYAKYENPFVVDAKGNRWNKLWLTEAQESAVDEYNAEHPDNPLPNPRSVGVYTTREISEIAQALGYDSVYFKDIVDDGGRGSSRAPKANIVIMFDPNNVKSADVATYANTGGAIAPSERFDTTRSDFRYSAADTSEVGNPTDYQDWYQSKAQTDRQPISAEQLNNTQGYRAEREAINIPYTGTKKGYVTDRNAQTIANAGISDDAAVESIKSSIANGAYQHMPYSDSAAYDRASKEIERIGWEKTLGKYEADVLAGKASKNITTMGIALYNNAVTEGRMYDAMDIASLMIKNASSVGAALQANRMLSKVTPDGRLYMAVRSIENIAEELRGIYGDEYGIELDYGLIEDYRNALVSGTEAQQKEAWKAIEQSIADQIPNDWKHAWKLKFNNWRYMAMLGNPRTHIRNIVGNLGFMPVRLAKQGLKAVMERMVQGRAGEGSTRTTALLNPFSSEDKARRQAARDDYDNVVDLIQSGGKMTSTKGEIENLRTIYPKAKFLEWFRQRNGDLLDREDTWFSRPAYAEALASFLKARGIDGDAFAAGNISPDLLNRAREHAILEAQKATYRDSNQFSDWVSSLGKAGRQKNATKVQKLASGAVEAVLPFKKTPANILVRAVEYSPAEFAQVFFGDIKKIRQAQKATQDAEAKSNGSAQALREIAKLKENESLAVSGMLDHIASGLTGTVLLGLGALLRNIGFISGGKDPDKEQAAFDDLHGTQEYSVNIGGINYTIDWLAPEALPLFTGVTLFDKIKQMRNKDEDEESDVLTDVWNLVVGLGEPMLNMSMLSSVNDLVSKMTYLDDATQLPALLGQIGYSYVSQYIPTLFGQGERVWENRRESTYYDRDDKISKDLQYALGKTANKIPVWDYNQIPYLDAWGREQQTGEIGGDIAEGLFGEGARGVGSVLGRVVSNMLSPGYTRKRNGSELDDELQRLHDLGFDKVLPERTTQSTKVDQEYMNEQEYVAYARMRGQTALADLTALTNSKSYQNMTDEQKADAVARIFSDAKKLAEDTVREIRGGAVKGTSATKAGMDTAAFSAAKTVYDSAEIPSWFTSVKGNEDKEPGWAKALAVLDDSSLSKSDRLKFINAASNRKEDFKTYDEAKAYYTEARDEAKLEIKYAPAKDVYDNAATPSGYKKTDAGNTPGWAKMLALLDSKGISDSLKLEYINSVSSRKDPFESLSEAREYYEGKKADAKIK